MANPLDWAARAILQINGMKPEEIKQKARQLKRQKAKKPMPKANTKAAKPQVQAPDPGPNSRAQGRNLIKEGAKSLKKPKPPARPQPGSTQVKGQTNLMNKDGKPRDFRNPKVSANRQPTTTPVQTRSSKQATPPKRPAGGFGNRPATGQGSVFGNNPSAKPNGNFRAPSVPKAGSGTKPPAPKPAAPKVSAGDAAAARAVRAVNLGKRLNVGRFSGAATGLTILNTIDDSRLSDSQKAKKYETVDPNRGQKYLDKLKTGTLGQPTKAKPQADTSKSGKASSTANHQRPKAQVSTPSAAKQATDKRDKKKLF